VNIKLRKFCSAGVLALGISLLAGACTTNVTMDYGLGHMGSSDTASDAMFAQMMIPHHEQAVVMADLAVTRAQDPEIVALAADIKAAQAPEIELMISWLDQWGVPKMPAHEAMMAHGGHGMSGMLTSAQLDQLAATSGAEFDRLFTIYMIEHHEGAIDMARDVLRSGSDPAVAKLAREIIATQEKEILQMQAFLQTDVTSVSLPITPALSHIHGAVISDGRLLVGTHDGLHMVDLESGTSTRVGDSRDDLMALAGQPGEILVASGHPGPGSDAANPLGLVFSVDGGVTWEEASLAGEVDFHSLAVRGAEIVGWDTRGPLQWSTDGGRTWKEGPQTTLMSIAWFRDDVWVATSDAGLMTWQPGNFALDRSGVPGVLIAATPEGDALWRLDRDGTIYRTTDGSDWSRIGAVSRVEAFAADSDYAYAISANEIQRVGPASP
jgi:uncharacterized protein (DUF305 family)